MDLEAALAADPTNLNLFLQGIKVGEVGAIHLQRHVLQHPNLRFLELKGSTLGRRGAEYLAQGLRLCHSLQHLGLGRNSLDYNGAVAVLKALRCTPIETLDLEWNGLQDGVCPHIAALLHPALYPSEDPNVQDDSTLVALSLERNEFRSEGIAMIAEALPTNTKLRNLNFAFNRCGATACEKLGQMLSQNRTLLTLNLMQCSIATDVAKHLVRGLQNNKTLVSINLSQNQALDAFTARLSPDAVLNPSLAEFNISSNRVSAAYVESIASVLSTGSGLMALSLGQCLIGEPQVRHVIRAISQLTRLVTLDLSSCMISATSGELLSDMVSLLPNLGTLYLDDNPLGRFGMEALSVGLASCAYLTSLNLCNCDIGRDGMLALANAIKKRRGLPLRELRLSGNNLAYEGCLTLCDALCSIGDNRRDGASQLEVLDISANGVGGRSCAFLAAVLQAHQNTLQTVKVRANPIAEELKQTFLTFDNALTYTGGVVCDPTSRTKGTQEDTKGTFELSPTSKARQRSMSFEQANPQDTSNAVGHTNFNGSSAAQKQRIPDLLSNSPPRDPSGRNYNNNSNNMTATSRATPITSSSTAVHPSEQQQATKLIDAGPYVQGLAPMIPAFKTRHPLHMAGDNIGQFPITDTQLRVAFTRLDAACMDYILVEQFLEAAQELDPIAEETSLRSLRKQAMSMCPNGRMTFDQFSVLMLRLARN